MQSNLNNHINEKKKKHSYWTLNYDQELYYMLYQQPQVEFLWEKLVPKVVLLSCSEKCIQETTTWLSNLVPRELRNDGRDVAK